MAEKKMRRRRSYREHDYLKGKETSKCAKFTLFFLNLLFWLCGGVLLGIGIYATVLQTVTVDLVSLATNPGVILIGVGGIVFFIGFLGCVGSLRENKCMLKLYGFLMLGVLILEIGAGVAAFLLQDEFVEQTKNAMLTTIRRYHTTNMQSDLDDAVEVTQRSLKCCGANGPRDWPQNNIYFNCTKETFLPLVSSCGVPPSCCILNALTDSQCGYKVFSYPNQPKDEKDEYPNIANISEVINDKGCADAAIKWVKDNYIVLGGAAFGVVVIEIVVLLMACHLVDQINYLLDHM